MKTRTFREVLLADAKEIALSIVFVGAMVLGILGIVFLIGLAQQHLLRAGITFGVVLVIGWLLSLIIRSGR